MQANKKRLIQNVVLLIIVAALAYFVATREDGAGKKDRKPHQTLYDKSFGDEVTKITLHAEGLEEVVLQNQNASWYVIKPEKFMADSAKVQHLFTLLSENADSQYAIEGLDLSKYGLDKNKLSIRFDDVLLVFGKFNEITQQRYILKGDTMYLVSETISGLIQSGAEGFKPQPPSTNESAQ